MKTFYLPSVFTNNVSGLGTPSQTIFGIKTIANEGRDSTAAQGVAKLNLFNVGAVLDYEADKASLPLYAVFGTAMKVALENNRYTYIIDQL